MTRSLFLAALFSAASIHSFAATPRAATDAPASLAAFHAALAKGDKEAALALLAPKVAIYESGYVEASREEYAHHHLVGDIAFAKTSTRKVLRHSEKLEGNTAIIWEQTSGNKRKRLVPPAASQSIPLVRKPPYWRRPRANG